MGSAVIVDEGGMLSSSGGSLVQTACPLGFTSDRGARRGLPVRDDAFGVFRASPTEKDRTVPVPAKLPKRDADISKRSVC